MRFTQAWAKTVAQNVTLQFVVAVLATTTTTLAFSTAKLSFRKPLVIERGCISRSVGVASTDHTASEIENFIREAIRQRFNTDALPIPDYLSTEEESARSQEQKELLSRSMTQLVVVRGVKINGNILNMDADRLISVGQIRSAFIFPLTATITATTRSDNNPYGIQLLKVSPPKMEERK